VRILLTIGTLNVGGTETQLCRLARELTDSGHEVVVFALDVGGPLARTLDEGGIPWRAFGWRGPLDVATTLRFWKAIKDARPDVCHAFLFRAYSWTIPGAALARVPARIQGRRGLNRSLSPRLFDKNFKKVANRLTHVFVANSEAVANDAVEHERISSTRVRVIRNGVDIPAPAGGVDRQPPVGLMVANLIRYKGHADLIEALGLLDRPPVVRLAGIGPEEEILKRQVKLAGLERVCIFEGLVPSASRLFQEVQFGVLASHDEGLPNALLEGMAAGVPMIATAVGGVPELIEDGVSGLLVPASDPLGLARAVNTLAADPALRQRLGAEGRRRATGLSWDVCRRAHLELYHDVLGRRLRSRTGLGL